MLLTLASQSRGILSVASSLGYRLITTTSHGHLLVVSKRGALMGQYARKRPPPHLSRLSCRHASQTLQTYQVRSFKPLSSSFK